MSEFQGGDQRVTIKVEDLREQRQEAEKKLGAIRQQVGVYRQAIAQAEQQIQRLGSEHDQLTGELKHIDAMLALAIPTENGQGKEA